MADSACSPRATPRDIAAAFVKMYRATIACAGRDCGGVRAKREDRGSRKAPEPARTAQSAPSGVRKNLRAGHPRDKARAAAPRPGDMENGVWFKITVGRERNADPKWLLPEICRQGEITKRDIGAIRVYERETRFEVSPDAAEAFAAHVSDARKKGGVRIFPAPDGQPPAVSTRPTEPTTHAKEEKHQRPARKPYSYKPKGGKTYPEKRKKY